MDLDRDKIPGIPDLIHHQDVISPSSRSLKWDGVSHAARISWKMVRKKNPNPLSIIPTPSSFLLTTRMSTAMIHMSMKRGIT